MARDLRNKVAIAAAVLVTTVTAIMLAAQLGVLELRAGDMNIVMAKGQEGLTMDILYRTCPPNCGVDVNWRPLAR
jgi:hypothetical protein